MADVVEVEKEKEKELEVETKLRSTLQVEYDTRLHQEIKTISLRMQEENQKIVSEAVERIRKEMQPPSEKDIQKLLDQEYLEYTIEIPFKNEKRKFVIRELPHAVEKKIYKKVTDMLVPLASEIASLSINLLEGDATTKVTKLMVTFQPLLDVMVGVCAVILNPFGDDEDVDEEWVRDNVSSTRIVKIITAQIDCNKMRDFFSLLFQGSKLLK